MSQALICQSCGEPKANLERRKSKVTSTDILICATCTSRSYEPRHLLIIAYHSGDRLREKSLKYIKEHLYVGKTIELQEIL